MPSRRDDNQRQVFMTFEQQLFDGVDADEQGKFKKACERIFATEEGRVVLGALCRARHPMHHFSGMTDHAHGQAEVVATLWRYGSPEPVPPVNKPTA